MNLKSEIIGTYWPLTNVILGKTLQKSEGRITGELLAREGKYVYKIADPIKKAESLEKDTEVFKILNERKFPYISTLLKTRTGDSFQEVDGRFIYLLRYVEGKNPDATPETYKKLAAITSILHTIKDYPFQTDFKASGVVPDLIKNSENYSFGKEYRKIVENLPNFDGFPQTLIHTDIHPGNTIETPGGDFILIDWDDAGAGSRILDLGCIMNQIANEDLEPVTDNIKAFFNVYVSCAQPTDEEIKYIFDAGLFFALFYIRFGNMEKRWKRILWLLNNKDFLVSSIFG